jgi:DNA-binding CsgD family transcriptional regulator
VSGTVDALRETLSGTGRSPNWNHSANGAVNNATEFAAVDRTQGLNISLPTQRLPENHQEASAHRPATVLVADPGGALGEVLRPALVEFAGCRILRAGSVSEVFDLVSSGVTGELAMVSLRFHGNTPAVIRALRDAGWPRVLALTTSTVSVGPVIEAVKAGAGGVLKIAGVVDIEPDPLNPARNLSARELEVVRLVADGWSNKAIARQLSLSALTVKNHLARIGRKFGVGDRAHIVAIACRGGVIPGLPGQPFGPEMTRN